MEFQFSRQRPHLSRALSSIMDHLQYTRVSSHPRLPANFARHPARLRGKAFYWCIIGFAWEIPPSRKRGYPVSFFPITSPFPIPWIIPPRGTSLPVPVIGNPVQIVPRPRSISSPPANPNLWPYSCWLADASLAYRSPVGILPYKTTLRTVRWRGWRTRQPKGWRTGLAK